MLKKLHFCWKEKQKMAEYLSAESWEPSVKVGEDVKKIIKEKQKNLSVRAGPGAGKTEILAQRANFLLQTATCKSPQKILALSFKVDAAANIESRVNLRCGIELGRRFDSFTFDAFFSSIVRRFISLLPDTMQIPADFDVSAFDRNWWANYETTHRNGEPFQYKENDRYACLDLIEKPECYEIVDFWKYCAEQKIADYSMVRSMAFKIVKTHEEIRNLIASTYKYLFLDEFQDTTTIQYNFLETIFKYSTTTVTAVGDTNQMIMKWAGADSENFNNFKKDFNSGIIPLDCNYRSNSKIIELINYIIKDLTPSGEEPICYTCARIESPPDNCIGAKDFKDIESEATYIAKYIKIIKEKDTTLMPGDFALILRQQSQQYFNEVDQIFKENGFALRNEDESVPSDGIKIQELMSEPLSILLILLIRHKVASTTYAHRNELKQIISSLTGYDLDNDRDNKKLKIYIDSLISCIELSEPIESSVTKILDTIGHAKIKASSYRYKSSHLKKVQKSFCTLFKSCLEECQGNIEKAIENYEGTNQIKLMTIHKSKGLEFNTVFFVDFNGKSWWALRKAVNSRKEDEQKEEKKSFFVGLSRAKDRLFFTNSKRHEGWPPIIKKLLDESNFLEEMPDI